MSFKWVKLSDVCERITDGSHFSPKTVDEGFPYITVRDIDKDNINFESCKFVTKEDFNELSKNGCSPKLNDLLFSKDGTVGKVALVSNDVDFVVLSSLAILTPKLNLINPSFLFYVLKSPDFVNTAIGKKTGVAIRRIILKNLKDINIPLPSLLIQKKIVAKLDEIFAEIDIAKAAAEANAKNSEALFQSYLSQVFKGDGCWIEKTLGECFELYQPKTITTKDLIADGEYQVYGANGVIGRYNKYNHEEPQLLVTCRGATCGSVNISSPFSWINGNAMVVKPMTKDIDVRFVEYFFRGAVDLTKAITGAAQPQITRQSLSPILFNYPVLKIQKEIVIKLDSLSAEISKSVNSYKVKVVEFTKFKQSILTKAFNGELVKE